MSWLSKSFKKLGKGAKRLVTNPGKWAENVGRSAGATARTIAPVLSIVPGVGPLAAAGIGALGNVAAGGNMKGTLSTGLKTYGTGQLLGAIPGVSSVGSKIGSGLSKVPGADALAGFAKGIPGAGTFLPSSATAAGGASSGITSAIPDSAMSTAGGRIAGGAAEAALPASGGLSGALKGVLGAAKANPLVVGQIASGVLQARQQGAQNDFQREQFEYQKQQTEDERKRRQTTADMLAPLFQSYLARASSAQNPWANYKPYTPFGGGAA